MKNLKAKLILCLSLTFFLVSSSILTVYADTTIPTNPVAVPANSYIEGSGNAVSSTLYSNYLFYGSHDYTLYLENKSTTNTLYVTLYSKTYGSSALQITVKPGKTYSGSFYAHTSSEQYYLIFDAPAYFYYKVSSRD